MLIVTTFNYDYLILQLPDITTTRYFTCNTGKSPYEGVSNADILCHLQEGKRLPCPDGCSDFW